jgi:hypothetical protein
MSRREKMISFFMHVVLVLKDREIFHKKDSIVLCVLVTLWLDFATKTPRHKASLTAYPSSA